MDPNFQNKTVLITGTSSGFGLEMARLFASQGAKLILIARRKDRLDELSNELKEKYGTESLSIELDVTNYESVIQTLDSLPSNFATIDLLINNAGLARSNLRTWEINPEEWNAMIDTNLKGVLNITRRILPKMIERNQGHIINIGSVAGHESYPGGNVYCATKFGLRALTDSMRMELVNTPIRVSLISPGMANTEFSLVRFQGNDEKAKKVYEGLEPLTAQDIAEATLFIATRPPHVNIADLVIYPKNQASTTIVHRKESNKKG